MGSKAEIYLNVAKVGGLQASKGEAVVIYHQLAEASAPCKSEAGQLIMHVNPLIWIGDGLKPDDEAVPAAIEIRV